MEIELNMLAAVSLFAAGDKETRWYLKGVYFNGRNMIASDGHQIAVAKLKYVAPEPVIIPIDVIVKVLKIAEGAVVELDVPGRTIGGIPFTPIEGTYPDWRRVLPDPTKLSATALPQIDLRLLARIAKAVKALKLREHAHRWLAAGDKGEGLLSWFEGRDDLFVYTMPMREDATNCPMTEVLS